MPQTDSRENSYPRSCTKDGEGPPSLTALLHRQGLLSRQAGACPFWEQECWEEAPPGSAGVPPACASVACRSFSLRSPSRSPCLRERHRLGRSRVPAPSPVDPSGGGGPGYAKACAGGTPALPGGLDLMTSSQQRRSIGLRVRAWFVFNNHRQFLPPMICPAGRGLAGRFPLFQSEFLG